MANQSLLKDALHTQLNRIMSTDSRKAVGGKEFYPDDIYTLCEANAALKELIGARILGVCPQLRDGELMITYKSKRARRAVTIIIKARNNELDTLPFMADGE